MSATSEDQATVEGAIYQASYRIQAGHPVVHLYGTLSDGDSFLVRQHGRAPHFYIANADCEQAQSLGAQCAPAPVGRNFAGEPVIRVEVTVPADVPPLRDRLQHAGSQPTKLTYGLAIGR